MTAAPATVELIGRLAAALEERFSDAGHVMQQNHREHQGHCPVTGCSLRCRTYAALLVDAAEWLEEHGEQAPRQPGLFDDGAGDERRAVS